MSYIYDSFANRAVAEGFAHYVTAEYGLDAEVFDTADEANAHDPFPYQLYAPIVHVERGMEDTYELTLQVLAEAAGGKYVGT